MSTTQEAEAEQRKEGGSREYKKGALERRGSIYAVAAAGPCEHAGLARCYYYSSERGAIPGGCNSMILNTTGNLPHHYHES